MVSGSFTVSQVGVVQSATGRDIVLSGVGAAVIGGVLILAATIDAVSRRRPGVAALVR